MSDSWSIMPLDFEPSSLCLQMLTGVPPDAAKRLCYGTLYGTPRILRFMTIGKCLKDGERGRNRTFNLLIKS
ncbi:MAG: hypothetical protein WBS24_11195, partial [Terriglobales bacterium]